MLEIILKLPIFTF